jgi:pimeloyl-ACP methyl ester carboxylesterase
MATVHHRYATVNGRRLFYREAGPAGAPAVVLLHPGTISAQIGQGW